MKRILLTVLVLVLCLPIGAQQRSQPSSEQTVWIKSIEYSQQRPVTMIDVAEWMAAWSPNSRILIVSHPDGSITLKHLGTLRHRRLMKRWEKALVEVMNEINAPNSGRDREEFWAEWYADPRNRAVQGRNNERLCDSAGVDERRMMGRKP